MKALLIGREPERDLGYSYVTQPPYDAVVIGSLTFSQLLQFFVKLHKGSLLYCFTGIILGFSCSVKGIPRH